MLEVKNINVYYGAIHAIKDISFQVNQGEVVSLIGANGAGKSTTLNAISGLLRPKTGTIEFNEKNIQKVEPYKIVKAGLAQVPEGRHVFGRMTVQENLDMGAFTRTDDDIKVDMEGVYERLPRLYERRKQLAGTLSGGEQQMLAMGRAIMSRPSMLMLDEPSMGLAPLLVEEIFNIIVDLKNDGKTILLVEQNAKMALSIADRAYVLESGKIVLEGKASDLQNNEAVKSAYLGG